MTHPDQDNLQQPPTATSQAGRRRRFLGAGVAAAPLVLTMVSQPALGATCFSPSRSLSKNTSISQNGFYGQCTGAESPGNYKTQQVPGQGAYHWPKSPEPTDPFHDIFAMGGKLNVNKFVKSVDGEVVSMTFGEVLWVNAPGRVAFHIIGAYLNKKGGNGAVIPDVVITEQGIIKIWSDYVINGFYAPTAGVEWRGKEIKAYLIENGIVKLSADL